jgi:hypothetical protein
MSEPTLGYYGFALDNEGRERLMWIERKKEGPGTVSVYSLWLTTTGTFDELMVLCGELNGQGEILPPQAKQVVGPVL